MFLICCLQKITFFPVSDILNKELLFKPYIYQYDRMFCKLHQHMIVLYIFSESVSCGERRKNLFSTNNFQSRIQVFFLLAMISAAIAKAASRLE